MDAGWYDDPFTDHYLRYWNGESWTKETRPKPDPSAPPPIQPVAGMTVPDYLVFSIIALFCCAWPLAIPAIYFGVKTTSARNAGDMDRAKQASQRARLFLILSAVFGLVVWAYVAYVLATTDVSQIEQGTVNPFGT